MLMCLSYLKYEQIHSCPEFILNDSGLKYRYLIIILSFSKKQTCITVQIGKTKVIMTYFITPARNIVF